MAEKLEFIVKTNLNDVAKSLEKISKLTKSGETNTQQFRKAVQDLDSVTKKAINSFDNSSKSLKGFLDRLGESDTKVGKFRKSIELLGTVASTTSSVI